MWSVTRRKWEKVGANEIPFIILLSKNYYFCLFLLKIRRCFKKLVIYAKLQYSRLIKALLEVHILVLYHSTKKRKHKIWKLFINWKMTSFTGSKVHFGKYQRCSWKMFTVNRENECCHVVKVRTLIPILWI